MELAETQVASVPTTETSTVHRASLSEASFAVHTTWWSAPTAKSLVSASHETVVLPLMSAEVIVRVSLVPSSTLTELLHDSEGTTESAWQDDVSSICAGRADTDDGAVL